eukprot:COSAG01_NODE_173_length_23099_cov_37.564783_6_plen_430_part_00
MSQDPLEMVLIGHRWKCRGSLVIENAGSAWKDGWPCGVYISRRRLSQLKKVGGAVMAIMFIAHIAACFWYFMGSLTTPPTLDTNRSGSPVGESGWLDSVGLSQDDAVSDKYLWSFYWSITVLSTVGYGDVTAHSTYERLFSVFVTLVGCMGFSALSSLLTSMSMKATLSDERVNQRMQEVQEFFTAKKVNQELQGKIRLTMKRAFTAQALDERQIMEQLPQNLQQELQEELKKNEEEKISNIRLFDLVRETKDTKLIRTMMEYLQPLAFKSRDKIYCVNERAYEVYVVLQGEVNLHSPHSHYTFTIEQGEYFGEREMFLRQNSNSDPTINVTESARCYCDPLEVIKRQQTATVVSELNTEIQYIDWGELVELEKKWRAFNEHQEGQQQRNASTKFLTIKKRESPLEHIHKTVRHHCSAHAHSDRVWDYV